MIYLAHGQGDKDRGVPLGADVQHLGAAQPGKEPYREDCLVPHRPPEDPLPFRRLDDLNQLLA